MVLLLPSSRGDARSRHPRGFTASLRRSARGCLALLRVSDLEDGPCPPQPARASQCQTDAQWANMQAHRLTAGLPQWPHAESVGRRSAE